ncbi:inositol 2-dehydrogenase [Bacteriovoracaceae bacterium]|nr:inositol 2-dehydrogenase [Bacteriovoracaceae bacterium]
MKKNIAILGLGRIGQIHLENLCSHSFQNIEITSIFDCDQEKTTMLAQKFGIKHACASAEEVFDNPDVDGVCICTPTDTHAELIIQAISKRKSIFCEKPIDHSVQKVLSIIDLVRESKTHFMVGFNRRFDPHFSELQQSLVAGKIGGAEIIRITSRDPSPPPLEYVLQSGGLFADMTIHDFDMARFLLPTSEVQEVFAFGSCLTDPRIKDANDCDSALVSLKFADGTLATIDNSRRAVYGYDQRIEVHGSQGMLSSQNPVLNTNIHMNQFGSQSSPLHSFFIDRYQHAYKIEMAEFCRSLLEDTPPSVTAKDGLMAIAIAECARLSWQEGRVVHISEVLPHAT